MKFSLWALAFLSISCGKYEVTGVAGNSIGESRSTNLVSQVSGVDRNNLTQICSALAQKAVVLPTSVNVPLTFLASQTDCSGNTVNSGNVDVVIQNNAGNFVFRKQSDNQEFIFPNVETNTSGVLADVCASLSNLQTPLVGAQGATYFTTSGINSSDCSPVIGEICVQVEMANQQGNTFVVHTKEWLRIRTNSAAGKIGFFTDRKKITRGFCGLNESLTFQATLK